MKLVSRLIKTLLVMIFVLSLDQTYLNITTTKVLPSTVQVHNQEAVDEEKMLYERGGVYIEDEEPEDANNTNLNPIFAREDLSEEVIQRISGVSWKEGAPIALSDLSYLIVSYWNFDGQECIGELIVYRKIAEEMLEIFQELYEAEFPIAKMKLIDEYGADDDLSMQDNNTSAFCFRKIEGSQKISKHGYGIAIDINPIQNPYVKGNKVLPSEGKTYLNRKDIRKGMITEGDVCYNAFVTRGWVWGGQWKTVKDYQHFEKDII
ncbi:D-alanyl-D-alanine carboxypeptidase [Clostridium aceticum]|uniref:D-alanyl-D-alanine carboxypeptidase n=1 Tax=Clostridium aceticum TaxID=84022 RepID=A0A0G3W8V5_9CLOT|nr:M15 family metallopeptidase [Clostridium aceticum]AKL94788.1 D-alanyl-D-alanine carboxypeptidase [Clostridium aceticum]